MSAFAQHLEDYLGLRRALGHQLANAGRLLPRFVDHLDDIAASTITVEIALAWVQQPDAGPSSSVWMRRMTAVRGFARHMSGLDPATEVPPLGLVTFHQRWRPPFIYSDADVVALMAEVPRLVPTPLRAATFQTMIGLLAATGMRVGEAIVNCPGFRGHSLVWFPTRVGVTRLGHYAPQGAHGKKGIWWSSEDDHQIFLPHPRGPGGARLQALGPVVEDGGGGDSQGFRSSSTEMASRHSGQVPPTPTLRMKVPHSSHRCWPSILAPHPSQAYTVTSRRGPEATGRTSATGSARWRRRCAATRQLSLQ